MVLAPVLRLDGRVDAFGDRLATVCAGDGPTAAPTIVPIGPAASVPAAAPAAMPPTDAPTATPTGCEPGSLGNGIEIARFALGLLIFAHEVS